MLFLSEESEKYQEHSYKIHSSVIKSGQRKLFFNTLYFLNNTVKNCLVIYAGAASGKNLVLLARQYSDITFILFDVNPFNKKLIEISTEIKSKQIKYYNFLGPKNVYICNELFTDEICKVIRNKNKNVYLISDIRTGNKETHDTINIPNDMHMQKTWYYLLNAKGAMLKFRLPWASGSTRYLKGDIMLQPRIGPKSTETRLIVGENAIEIDYDNDNYNDRLYYYNRYSRNKTYEIDSNYIMPGMCYCNDCWMEVNIFKQCGISLHNYKYVMNRYINKLGDLTSLAGTDYTIKHIHFITPGLSQKVYILKDNMEVMANIDVIFFNELPHKHILNKYYLNMTFEEYKNIIG